MLRDKALPVKVTLPAMSSTNTVTIDLGKLGMGIAEQEAVKVVPASTGNYSMSKVKLSNGNYALRFTATGSVTASTVAWAWLMPIGFLPEVTVAAIDS